MSSQESLDSLVAGKKITVLAKYSDFANIFLKKLVEVLLKQIVIINYAIELKESNQLFFGLIYSLDPMELKIFQIYIKKNLANNFI